MTRLLRIKDVEEAVGFKKTKIYEMVNRGEFPKPVSLGARAVAWRSDEVERWINERPVAPNFCHA